MGEVNDALLIALYVLAGVAAIEGGAVVVLWRLLTRSRRRAQLVTFRGPRGPQVERLFG